MNARMPGFLLYLSLGLTLAGTGFLAGVEYGPLLVQSEIIKIGQTTPGYVKAGKPKQDTSVSGAVSTNASQTDPALPWLVLTGITRSDKSAPTALIEDCTGSQHAFKTGQVVADGYLLTDIRTSTARLDGVGQSLTLQLGRRSMLVDTTAHQYPVAGVDAPESLALLGPSAAVAVIDVGNAGPTNAMTEEEADQLFEPGPDINAMFDLPPEQETVAPSNKD